MAGQVCPWFGAATPDDRLPRLTIHPGGQRAGHTREHSVLARGLFQGASVRFESVADQQKAWVN